MPETTVLIVLHGTPPRPGSPVSGMGLRAWTLGEGLRAHGFQPTYATRAADAASGEDPAAPTTFESEADLHRLVEEIDPAVIVAVASDEVTRLPESGPPLVLDLFAPRLLERQFQERADDDEVVRLLDAIGRADHYLFSNPRQRDFHLGLLTAAGVDCRELPGAVVPLACPPEYPRRAAPREPVFVTGGVFWPWNDAREALCVVLEHLDRRGRGQLHLFGGGYPIGDGEDGLALDPRPDLPASERLHFQGFVPYDELLQRYARATAALDLALPNVERELSFGFRHVDYLRCGLPSLLGAGTGAADEIVAAGAALAVDVRDPADIRRSVDRLLDDAPLRTRLSRAAKARARSHHSWERAVAPLAEYCRRPRLRRASPGVLAATARERDGLARQLVRAGERCDELEQSLHWSQRRLADAEAERKEVWTLQRETQGERDEAWKAHAALAAELDALNAELERLRTALSEERERLARTEAHRDRLMGGLDEARDQIREFETELRRVKGQLDQTIGWRLKRLLDRARSS